MNWRRFWFITNCSWRSWICSSQVGQLQLLSIAQDILEEAYSIQIMVFNTETLLQIVIKWSFAVGCRFLSNLYNLSFTIYGMAWKNTHFWSAWIYIWKTKKNIYWGIRSNFLTYLLTCCLLLGENQLRLQKIPSHMAVLLKIPSILFRHVTAKLWSVPIRQDLIWSKVKYGFIVS